ncbi:MAG: hypothetical protein IT580_21500, partial [Verrucomicrobiales bacterium]|nr:hypothetical protein [Verrucomicrobiales bacterium]
ASGEARQGAYLAIGGDVRRLVDTTMDFPVLGREAAHVQAIGVDGTVSAVLVANRSLSAAVVVRVTDDGTLTEVMKLGDLIPGTTAEVRTFGPLAVKDGAITLFAYDPSFAVHVVQWRDGTRTLLAKPGMEIPGVGTLSSIDSSEVHLAGDKVFLDGRMRRTEGGVVYGVFTASAAGLQSVLTSPKLDARRINGVSLMHATEQRLLLAVRFEQGGAAYVANVGPADAEPPVLLHSRDGQTGLRVTVPAGAMLEAAQALNGVWQTLPGTGEVLIPFDSAARFLRLKRP